MPQMFSKFRATAQPASQSAGRPPAAIEISPEGVLAAARPAARLAVAHRSLRKASSTPSCPFLPVRSFPVLKSQTCASLDAVTAAIRSTALDEVSPRTRAVHRNQLRYRRPRLRTRLRFHSCQAR